MHRHALLVMQTIQFLVRRNWEGARTQAEKQSCEAHSAPGVFGGGVTGARQVGTWFALKAGLTKRTKRGSAQALRGRERRSVRGEFADPCRIMGDVYFRLVASKIRGSVSSLRSTDARRSCIPNTRHAVRFRTGTRVVLPRMLTTLPAVMTEGTQR